MANRVRFSKRTEWDVTPSAWAAAPVPEDVVDLTVSNPTVVDLPFDREVYARALAHGAAQHYQPRASGLEVARHAIAAYYERRGARVAPEQIFVTASTSEAYGALFTLLADAGDAVLVPTPGYPLFDTLAELGDVRVERYSLEFDGDRFSTPAALPSVDARAIVIVSPNNPTGHVTDADTDETLMRIATARSTALIVDEVFLDSSSGAQSFARRGEALRFTLSGLSKVAGLPGAKLSWIVVSGPAADVEMAIGRLEVVLDARLSVASPVQHALPELLDAAEAWQVRMRRRLQTNRRAVAKVFGSRALVPQGGWSTIVRVDGDDEATALTLLSAGVRVQPGFLYDLPFDGLVLSTLVPEGTLEVGLNRMRRGLSFEASDRSGR